MNGGPYYEMECMDKRIGAWYPAHEYGEDGLCRRCGAEEPEYPDAEEDEEVDEE